MSIIPVGIQVYEDKNWFIDSPCMGLSAVSEIEKLFGKPYKGHTVKSSFSQHGKGKFIILCTAWLVHA